MKKTIVMRIAPEKETKGCHRYVAEAGDRGCETLYLRKSEIEGSPPAQITVTITGD